MNNLRLSDEEFFNIYNKVPRLNVDLKILSGEKILLAYRTIEPNTNNWHLPGGTVYKGERIEDASKRIAKNETGLDVDIVKCIGYMEFPDEIRSGVNIHTVSIVIEVVVVSGELMPDKNAKELKYFDELPENMITEHKNFLIRDNKS